MNIEKRQEDIYKTLRKYQISMSINLKTIARHHGFTEEELDFIINHDIKYRIGGELEGEE